LQAESGGNCSSISSKIGSSHASLPLSARNRDLLRGSHDLPLCDLIHGIDVVDPFDAIAVSLMHGVHSQVAWPALWIGFPSLADAHRHWPGRLINHPSFPVRPMLAQVVNVRYRNSAQPFVIPIPIFVILPV
jgi:hypothetical protein